MLFEELDFDLSCDTGQLFYEEDVFGVHMDDGMHLHQ